MYNDLVDNQRFNQRILISTSVPDCGVNIIDKDVNNIVIACDDESDFIQMLGRKRVDYDEKVNLYIKFFGFKTINSRYNGKLEELKFLIKFSLKNSGIGNEPQLKPYDFVSIGKELLKYQRMAMIFTASKSSKYPLESRGFNISGYDYELFLKEYEYSKTAYLNIIFQLYSYTKAMSSYRSEKNRLFIELNRVFTAYEQKVSMPNALSAPLVYSVQEALDTSNTGLKDLFTRIKKSQKSNLCKIDLDFRSKMDRDSLFYLKYQLSWIGKEYNESCWVKIDELKLYLESLFITEKKLREDDNWSEQKEFSMKCTQLMLALPNAPKRIKADASRYRNDPEKYPGKDKLNSCFRELDLPYMIVSSQKKYDGVDKKKTCWKIVKIQPDAENNEVVNNKKVFSEATE